MRKKTIEERYEDEILTDNTKISKCDLCKNCFFRDDGTVYSNDYKKSSCVMYPHPSFKPVGVIRSIEPCEFYIKE